MLRSSSSSRVRTFGVIAVVLGGVLLGPPVSGGTFTVGPGGTHGTIQDAIDAAVALVGGAHEVRVARGSYTENLSIPFSWTSGTLAISGGWNAPFTLRSYDRALTTIDGGASGQVVELLHGGSAEVVFEGFTVTNGLSIGGGGAGILVQPQPGSSATTTVRNNRITGNTDVTDFSAHAGGVSAVLTGTMSLFLIRNRIDGNLAVSNTVSAYAGGLDLNVGGDSVTLAFDNQIDGNIVRTVAPTSSVAGGVGVSLRENAFVRFTDNVISGNRLEGAGVGQSAGGRLQVGSFIASDTTGTLQARRNLWVDNLDLKGGGTAEQIGLRVEQHGILLFTDSVVAGGVQRGILADAVENGTLRLTNLTVADNGTVSLELAPLGSAVASVSNSIFFDNGSDPILSLAVATTNNHVTADGDPLFLDPSSRNYRLMPGSTALDAGTDTAPGGLGPRDLDGLPRIQGSSVDKGAYEATGIPVAVEAFESGDLSGWDNVFPR